MKTKFFLLAMLLSFFIGQPPKTCAQCPDGATQCAVTIACGDVYGDGWNGAAIKVWQGTTLRGTATLASGSYGEVEINICSGDSVRFEWQSGQLDNEAYFSIANGDGTVVVSGIFGADLHNGQTIATIWPTCPSCIRPQNLSATADSIPLDASYDIFIRAHCAAGVNSNWSQAINIRPAGIAQTGTTMDFGVYPNPATDHITVSLKGAHGEVHLLMTDLNGRTMRDISFVCDGDCGRQIELGAFPKGVYFVRISTQSDAAVRKVVIK